MVILRLLQFKDWIKNNIWDRFTNWCYWNNPVRILEHKIYRWAVPEEIRLREFNEVREKFYKKSAEIIGKTLFKPWSEERLKEWNDLIDTMVPPETPVSNEEFYEWKIIKDDKKEKNKEES